MFTLCRPSLKISFHRSYLHIIWIGIDFIKCIAVRTRRSRSMVMMTMILYSKISLGFDCEERMVELRKVLMVTFEIVQYSHMMQYRILGVKISSTTMTILKRNSWNIRKGACRKENPLKHFVNIRLVYVMFCCCFVVVCPYFRNNYILH